MPDGTRELRLVVTAPDYDSALRFYRDALGLREEASFEDDNGGRATLLHAGRATIEVADDLHAEAIDTLEVGRRVAGPVRLAFEVDDAAETADRLLAAGGSLVGKPVRTPWGSVNARLDGPDGQQLTVYSNDIYLDDRPRLDDVVLLAEPDPTWATTAADLVREIREALPGTALVVAHVGSTSVPGLPAKPVIDLVLGVPDPVDEPAYVPALEARGYHLRIREPEWHEHRLLGHTDPTVNLHVFGVDASEIDRMVAFRDHLRSDPRDRELYLRTKRELASRTWEFTQDYADAKSEVVADIMTRALQRGPVPLRGCFIVVRGTDSAGETPFARGLAVLLGLPLLAEDTARGTLLAALGAAPDADPVARDEAVVQVLLALAADTGGAVLQLASPDRTSGLARLPGRVIEIDRAPAAPADLQRIARRVRLMASGG